MNKILEYAYFGCEPAYINSVSFNGCGGKLNDKVWATGDGTKYQGQIMLGGSGAARNCDFECTPTSVIIIGPHEIDYSDRVKDVSAFYKEVDAAYKSGRKIDENDLRRRFRLSEGVAIAYNERPYEEYDIDDKPLNNPYNFCPLCNAQKGQGWDKKTGICKNCGLDEDHPEEYDNKCKIKKDLSDRVFVSLFPIHMVPPSMYWETYTLTDGGWINASEEKIKEILDAAAPILNLFEEYGAVYIDRPVKGFSKHWMMDLENLYKLLDDHKEINAGCFWAENWSWFEKYTLPNMDEEELEDFNRRSGLNYHFENKKKEVPQDFNDRFDADYYFGDEEGWEDYAELYFESTKKKTSKKSLKEDGNRNYYFGFCCVRKKDIEDHARRGEDLRAVYYYPCFLGYSPTEKKFAPWGYSWYDILDATKKGDDPHNINNLWCEVWQGEDPQESIPREQASKMCKQLEVIFPDYEFYCTKYPRQDMDQYYKLGPNDMTEEEWGDWIENSDIGKAYMALSRQMNEIESPEKRIWETPF